MGADEMAVRELVARWHEAVADRDVDAVLGLMAEDAVFLVPGKPPILGREAFEQGLREVLTHHRIDSSGDVIDLEVSGHLAYCWTYLRVQMIPLDGGDAAVWAGSGLSVFRKLNSGAWVIARDANLLAATG